MRFLDLTLQTISEGVTVSFPARGSIIHYWVCYTYKTKEEVGVGCCGIDWDHPIKSMEDLDQLSRVILQREQYQSLTITNWRRFEE